MTKRQTIQYYEIRVINQDGVWVASEPDHERKGSGDTKAQALINFIKENNIE